MDLPLPSEHSAAGPPPRRLQAMRAVLAVVAPPCCAVCRVVIDAGGPLCRECLSALPRLGPVCARCALPAHAGRRCPAVACAFDGAWAPFAHDGVARALVHGLKLAGRLPLAAWMAGQMSPALAAVADGPGTAAGWSLVPVPAASARRRRRGFDAAELLAAELAGLTGVGLESVLRRRDGGARQVGARRGDRRAAGRIRVEATAAAPRGALLVDDVHTTGATLDACARALKVAGAERVVAVTFARTL